uniref:Secreted protein n=1 Tax=Craspedostauros australis TaxID=1486917 RepID=A0A7R9WN97_9STRA|mmetsp:Transcript_1242/g.3585  ORF Transcript_1242/g.3585 Transcript_1242/m.3585 type:complete len:127 (+) Transcript_1242:113-493(+)
MPTPILPLLLLFLLLPLVPAPALDSHAITAAATPSPSHSASAYACSMLIHSPHGCHCCTPRKHEHSRFDQQTDSSHTQELTLGFVRRSIKSKASANSVGFMFFPIATHQRHVNSPLPIMCCHTISA